MMYKRSADNKSVVKITFESNIRDLWSLYITFESNIWDLWSLYITFESNMQVLWSPYITLKIYMGSKLDPACAK